MNERKSLIHYFIEAYDRYQAEQRAIREIQRSSTSPSWLRRLAGHIIPNLGTVVIVVALLWAQSAGALPVGRGATSPLQTSSITIAYQGRLADANGNPLTGTYNMTFRLYDVPVGGVPLWEEQWTGSNSVKVSDGLFNVMLGSLRPIPQSVVAGRERLWLGVTVGTDDEMEPRVQLGSVPWAVQALTVPDGSITTEKIADGAVTTVKIADRNRYLWIPAANFNIVSDTPTQGTIGNWSANGVKFSDNGNDGIGTTWRIPEDRIAGTDVTLKFYYAAEATTGTVFLRHGWKTYSVGENVASRPEHAIDSIQNVLRNSWQVFTIVLSIPGSDLDGQELVGVFIHRLGRRTEDTARGDILFLGLEVFYEADS